MFRMHGTSSAGSSFFRKTHSVSFRDAFRLTLRTLWLAPFVVVVALAVALGLLIYRGVLPGDEFFRPVMERWAPIVLATTSLIALLRFATSRKTIFLWLFALAVVLLCREIHFTGTSAGVYPALGLLFYLSWCHYDRLGRFFASRGFVTLLVLVFFIYILSTSLDRSAWRFLPHREIWSSPLEELLELVGHIALGLAALVAREKENPLLTSSSQD